MADKAKIRFEGDAAREDMGSGQAVLPKQVIEVPVVDVWNYTQSDLWSAVDKAAKDAELAGRKARDERVRVEAGLPPLVPHQRRQQRSPRPLRNLPSPKSLDDDGEVA